MVKRISVFLIALLVVGLACYLFYLNPDTITVTYGRGRAWEAPAAIVLISIFFMGAAFVGLIGVYLGAKRSFIEWRRESKQKRHKYHEQLMLEGRSELALKNFAAARAKFQKVTREDPQNTLAWMLLADAVEDEANAREVLDVLDSARRFHKNNFELLFRAAALNEKLGNLTAAYDNVSLVLAKHSDNVPALKKAARYARSLKRFDEAITVCEQLISRLSGQERDKYQQMLAELEVERALTTTQDEAERDSLLQDVLKRHRDFAPALAERANISRSRGDIGGATKLLTKAFQQSTNPEYLSELSSMWLSENNPEKAISAVRNAVINAPEATARGKLYLSYLFLKLEVLDRAREELSEVRNLQNLTPHQQAFLDYLDAKLLSREGKQQESVERLVDIVENHNVLPEYVHRLQAESSTANRAVLWKRRKPFARKEAPPPRLSTP